MMHAVAKIMTALPAARPLALIAIAFLPAQLLASPPDAVSEEVGQQQLIQKGVNAHIRQHLQETAQQGSIHELEVDVQTVDRNLRLGSCTQPLRYQMNSGQRLPGRALVKVDCDGEKSWSLYVPASVAWQQDVVVTAAVLPRGHQIQASDVLLERRRLSRPTVHHVGRMSAVVGHISKRKMPANKAIDWRFLEQAKAVKKGDTLTLHAHSGSINVKINAEALAGGAIGDQIEVRNLLSQKVVKARITGRGRAEVPM